MVMNKMLISSVTLIALLAGCKDSYKQKAKWRVLSEEEFFTQADQDEENRKNHRKTQSIRRYRYYRKL
jgi:hypothetical protein